MNELKIHKDILFPKINGVNVEDLKVDWDCVSFITPPYDSKRIARIIIKHIKKYKALTKDVTVVDATACVGGDTIMLCSTFGKVIAIELDTMRHDNLAHNIKQYKFNNVELLNGDSTIIIPQLPIIDVIFLDVPWGGKDYKLQEKLRLDFGNFSLEQFILNCFNKQISQCPPKVVVSKMPKNYDIEFFESMMFPEYIVTVHDQLKKMNIIVIEKKDAVEKFKNKESLIEYQTFFGTTQNDKDIQENIEPKLIAHDIAEKITSKIINDAINNTLNNTLNKAMIEYGINNIEQMILNNINLNTNKNTQQYQLWDSSEDFSLNAPNKKTKLN